MAKIKVSDGDTPAAKDDDDVIKLHESSKDNEELAAKIEASAKALDEDHDARDKAAIEAEFADAKTDPKAEETPKTDPEDFDKTEHQDTPISQLVAQRESITPAPKLKVNNPSGEFADPDTSQAVDDIVSKETDEVLEAEDKAREEAEEKLAPRRKSNRFKDWLSGLWSNPAKRWGIIVGSALLLILISLLPTTRYAILNTVGVRVSSSIRVTDNSTSQPLKNVAITLGGVTQETNADGVAHFSKLKMGKTELKIFKRGFAELKRNQTLGWGSNPLADAALTPTGSQFVFRLTDFLSGKPVTKAEAVSDEFSAYSNDKGEISLVIDDPGGDIKVTINADGYRSEKVTFGPTDKAEKDLKLVAGNPQVFVSKRSGKYEVFKIDADGKNETKLLAATGKERSDIIISGHPTQNYAALVSTREGHTNKDGYLLSGLFVFDVAAGTNKRVTESERIQIADWQGDNLVYVQITEGASAANPKRSRLMSYNFKTDTNKELASANYFNDVYATRNVVYYAPSSYALPANSAKFYKVGVDGSGNQKLYDGEIYSIIRSDYDNLLLSFSDAWYQLKIGTTSPTKTSAPAETRSITFEDNADRTASLWVDDRDGKGVLLVKNVSSGQDKELQSKTGLIGPVRWLNATTVVYRVVNSTETAEYVVSTEGGDAKKLANVTNTGSADSYYYY